MTVETQALALFLRSNFFLTFLIGVFLRVPGMDASEIPGYSPCFHILFVVPEEEGLLLEGAANAERTSPKLEGLLGFFFSLIWLGLRVVGEGSSEEEKERYFEAMA